MNGLGAARASAPAMDAREQRRSLPLSARGRHQAIGGSLALVALVSVILAVVASAVSFGLGYATLYNDAKSHLNIARHVTDSLTPGLAQLGSVWLPLPHLLMTPLVANDFLWHSGAAGALVGGICFLYSSLRLFGMVEEWTGSRVGAWCALAAYVSNLNLLYLQSTALTEPVLLASFVAASFHLSRWLRTRAYSDLLWVAVWTQAATITRYDGWFFLVTIATLVLFLTWRWTRRLDAVEGSVLAYGVLAGYGILLWVFYNAVIFGDPLYFLHSVYSAQVQQVSLLQAGRLPTKGNLWVSSLTFAWDALDLCGPVVIVAGALGWLLVLFRPGRVRRETSVALLLALASPGIFNIIALYLGQSTMEVPQLAPYWWFNDRYGIVALPLLAAGVGALGIHLKSVWSAPVLGVVASVLLLATVGQPIVIVDGLKGASASGSSDTKAAAYLRTHYDGGRILADDYLSSPAMFASGVSLRDFVTVGEKPYFQQALESPGGRVRWVLRHSRDNIDQAMLAHPQRFAGFVRVYTGGAFTVYRLPSVAVVGVPPSGQAAGSEPHAFSMQARVWSRLIPKGN